MDKKEAARWARIKRVYGISKEQYDGLDTGKCPVCLRGWSPTVRPCIDHDHVTGEIRGLLCLYCNHRMVGRHRDAALVRRIADYLSMRRSGLVVPKKKPRKRKKKK